MLCELVWTEIRMILERERTFKHYGYESWVVGIVAATLRLWWTSWKECWEVASLPYRQPSSTQEFGYEWQLDNC